ncbi:GroES-like protein [Epithele typhae]|uniref:GroES-like protein n=1 Tax=Epithele typhae TaxID=378194 RepID=UPI0020083E79|nr:GroES-like protein [Epithele typhae]KAH9945307.1 GroES-like protein [Epithele typhae]
MALPQQHQALVFASADGSLQLQGVDTPTPGETEAIVKVETTAMNPADWWFHDNRASIKEWPYIVGFAASGTVVAVGTNVRNVKLGDRVLAQGGFTKQSNTFQQYIRSFADQLAKIPASMSFDEAATIATPAPSAVLPLYHPGPTVVSAGLTAPWRPGGRGKYAGQAAVVLAGASSVGQMALQFLKLSGFSPIIATASPHNTPLTLSYGATHVLPRTLSDTPAELAAEVARVAGSTPIAVVYDGASTAATQTAGLALLAAGGTLVLVHDAEVRAEAEAKGVKVVVGSGVMAFPKNRTFAAEFTRALEGMLEEGTIKPLVPEVVPGGLGAIPEGLAFGKAGKVSGKKLVFHPFET